MSDTANKSGIVNLCGLWRSEKNPEQVSTKLSDRTIDAMITALQAERVKPADQRARLMLWPNKFAQGDRDPTHKMVLLPNRPREEAPAAKEDFPF